MPRSCPYVSWNSTKDECVRVCRIFKRKKHTYDIWKAANLKYKYGNRHFWCRGYYVDTAGKNAKRIEAYIKNQLHEDKVNDQMTLRGFEDPFMGSK